VLPRYVQKEMEGTCGVALPSMFGIDCISRMSESINDARLVSNAQMNPTDPFSGDSEMNREANLRAPREEGGLRGTS